MSDPTLPGPPPHDELDALLKQWHDVNAERAAAGRDRLVRELRSVRQAKRAAATPRPNPIAVLASLVRGLLVNRYSPAIASLMFLVVIIGLLMPRPDGAAYAQFVMVAEGGKLEAIDDEGNVLGACPLAHTDVDVEISGFMSRVNVTQTYRNPYRKKIEAVYTFPLSHRAAVDRMTITVGDRVVVGEVKERQLARRIYEAARAQGYVAGLLEQQRPNIFTQSIANIEPDAEVIVKISYVEMLAWTDGRYSFDFPMVVGPRYVPGSAVTSPSVVPAELTTREGLVLLGPARLTVGAAGNTTSGTLQTGKLDALLGAARPIRPPGDAWWGRGDVLGGAGQPDLWYRFEATYSDRSRELGELHTDGTGRINGRWFYADPEKIAAMGTGFAPDTNLVPDASLITPQPVKPPTRAGHDISVTVTIDSGGPGVIDIESDLHDIVTTPAPTARDDGTHSVVTVTLADRNTIPNRDFVLSWRQTADTIQEATFAHTSDGLGEWSGGFFTLILQPPDRIVDAQVPPRELIFVMDTSGSMRGFPIEKSKAVMTRAIDAMRPTDTFNVITFAGRTAILWDAPKPATAPNRAEARAFVESRQGAGGTEMMQAINAALVQADDGPVVLSPRALADLPADNRAVEVAVPYTNLHATHESDVMRIPLGDDMAVRLKLNGDLPTVFSPHGVTVRLSGRWRTAEGRRELVADRVWLQRQGEGDDRPMRIVLFLTDGYVGNDLAIIDAVRRNASTTRVFPFGIGNSVNRYLLDGMARAGRGEAEFVLLETDAEQAVERFTRRVETPVLTDISLAFSEGLDVVDLLPAPGAIPDLFDARPLVIHGRYTEPGRGTLTIRGKTGAGAYERVVELDLPANAPGHDVIATLWARSKVDDVLAPHLKQVQQGTAPPPVMQEVIGLGEKFSIMTPFTSFVAVEKSRLTIGGEPVLVAVPIEMPDGVSWEGVFGNGFRKEARLLSANKRSRVLGGEMERDKLQGYFTPQVLNGFNTNGSTSATSRLRPHRPPPPAMTGPKVPLLGDIPLFDGLFRSTAKEPNGSVQKLEAQVSRVNSPERAPPGLPTGEGFTTSGARKKGAPGSGIGGGSARGASPGFAGGYKRLDEADVKGNVAERGASRQLREAAAAPEPEEARIAGDLELEADEVLLPPWQAMKDMLTDSDDAPADSDGRVLLDDKELARLRIVLAPELLTMKEGRVLVTVLVTDNNDRTRRALARAGLSIEAFSKSLPIVVGTVAVGDLRELALVPGVRFIEPTRMTRERGVARSTER